MGVTVIGGSAASGGTAKTLGTHTTSNKVDGEAEKKIKLPLEIERDGTSFSTITTSAFGHYFNGDGTRLYYHTGTDDFYYVPLSTAYDLSTGGAVTTGLLNINTITDGSPQFRGTTFNADGSTIYMVNHDAANEIFVLPLDTNYDIASANYTNDAVYKLETDFGITTPGDTGSWRNNSGNTLTFNGDGTRLYLNAATQNNLFEIPLTTAYDLSSSGTVVTRDLSTILTSVDSNFDLWDLQFTSDGKFAICASSYSSAHDSIAVLELSTAYDLSTASLLGSAPLSDSTGVYSLLLTPNDNSFIVKNREAATHHQYPLEYRFWRGKHATATADISSGNTFIVDDLTNFNEIKLAFSSPPSSGTLKSFDVTFKSSFDSLKFTDMVYRYRGKIGDLNNLSNNLNLNSATDAALAIAGKDLSDLTLAERGGNFTRKIIFKNTEEPYADFTTIHNEATQSTEGTTFAHLAFYPPYLSPSVFKTFAKHPHQDIYYAQDASNDRLIQFRVGIENIAGIIQDGETLHLMDSPETTNNVRYHLSNDGTYMYEFRMNDGSTEVKNYELTTPWDLSTMSATATTTGNLPVTSTVHKTACAVGFNGRFLFYKSSNSTVHVTEMSTAHDLATLTGEKLQTNIDISTNSNGISIPYNNDGLLAVNGGTSNAMEVQAYYLKVRDHAITLPSSCILAEGTNLNYVLGTSKTLNFTTSDGGTTYYVKEA